MNMNFSKQFFESNSNIFSSLLIFIYGCGSFGRKIYDSLKYVKNLNLFFIDGVKDKVEIGANILKVEPPSYLDSLQNQKVLIATSGAIKENFIRIKKSGNEPIIIVPF